jgi:hypothetical protein
MGRRRPCSGQAARARGVDRMIRPHAHLTRAAREAALDAYDDLLAAAVAARQEGWHRHEVDPVAHAARRLGVTVWPALVHRVLRDAAETTALVGY